MRGKRGVTRLLVAAAVVGWAALSVAVAFGQDGTVVLSGPSSYEPLPPGDVIESVASSEVSFTVPLAGGPFSGSAVLNLRHDVPARGCTFMSEHRWSITGEFSPATLQLVGTSQLDFQQTTGACGSFSLERTFTIEEGGERFVANVDPESGRVSGRLPVEFDFMVDPSLLASLATGADDTLIDQFTAEYAAASGLATASGTVSAPDLEADPNVTVLETDFAVEFSPVGGPSTVTGFGVFHNVIEFDDGARCEWESRRDVEGTGVFDPATGTIEGTHRIGGSDQVIACDFEIDFGTTAGSSPFALMVADDRVTGDIASFSLDLPISGFFEPQPLVGSFDLTGGSFLVNDDGSVRVGLMWDVIWPPAPVDDFLVGVEVPFEEGTVVAGIRMDDGEPSTFTDPEVGYGAMALDDGRVIIDVDRPTDFGDMIGPVRVRWWNVDEGGPSAIGDLELPSDATDPDLADVGPPSVILPFDLPELWADGSSEAPGGEAGDDELEGTFADGDPLPGQSDDGGGSSAGIFVIVSALIAAGVYFTRKYLRMPRTEPQSDHLPLGQFDLSQPPPEAPDELVEVPLSDPVIDDTVGPGEAADALAPLRERAQYVEAASDEQRQALIDDIGAVSRSTSQGVHNLHLRGAVGAIGRGDGVAAVKAIDHAIEALERQQDEDDQTGGLDPEDVQRYVEGGKGTSPPPDENDSGLDAVILGGPTSGRRRKWEKDPMHVAGPGDEHEEGEGDPADANGGDFDPAGGGGTRERTREPMAPGRCDWQFLFEHSQGTDVLRKASGHACCTYTLTIKALGIRNEWVAKGRQLEAGADDRFRVPDGMFKPRGLGFESTVGVRTGPEGRLDWMQGLGDPDDSASLPAPETGEPSVQRHQFEEPPDLAASRRYIESTSVSVTLDSDCPKHKNRYDLDGTSGVRLAAGAECTNTETDPACPVEFTAIAVGEALVVGGLDYRVAKQAGGTPDDLEVIEDEDGNPTLQARTEEHDHDARPRDEYYGEVIKGKANVVKRDDVVVTYHNDTDLHDGVIVPEGVFPHTERVTAHSAVGVSHKLEIEGEMKAPCSSGKGKGCCGHGVCSCASKFRLVITDTGTLVVDGQTYTLKRAHGALNEGEEAYWVKA